LKFSIFTLFNFKNGHYCNTKKRWVRGIPKIPLLKLTYIEVTIEKKRVITQVKKDRQKHKTYTQKREKRGRIYLLSK
jgi:hypothetical protein